MVFIIRAMQGQTRVLMDRAIADPTGCCELPAMIDGPYGHPEDLRPFSTCVFIAGAYILALSCVVGHGPVWALSGPAPSSLWVHVVCGAWLTVVNQVARASRTPSGACISCSGEHLRVPCLPVVRGRSDCLSPGMSPRPTLVQNASCSSGPSVRRVRPAQLPIPPCPGLTQLTAAALQLNTSGSPPT